MLTTARDLLIVVIAGCAVAASFLLYNRPAAESENAVEVGVNAVAEISDDAFALADTIYFAGKITPEQAEKIIRAAMRITQFDDPFDIPHRMKFAPYYTGMAFNDMGDVYLTQAVGGIVIGKRSTKPLTIEQEEIRLEGECLRATAPMRLHPERWTNMRYLGQNTMGKFQQKYIPSDTAHNRKLAVAYIILAIELKNSR